MIYSIAAGLLLGTLSSATVFLQEDTSHHGLRTLNTENQIIAPSDRDERAGIVSALEERTDRNPSFRALAENSRDLLSGYLVTAAYSDTTCLNSHAAVGIKLGACLKDTSSYTIATATTTSSMASLNIRRTSYSDSSCKVQIGAPKVFTHAVESCDHSAQYYVTPTPTFMSVIPGVMIR